ASGPRQAGSAPPHALHIAAVARASAAAIVGPARPSPGTGQAFECLPASRAAQQVASTFEVVAASRPLSFATAAAQRRTASPAGGGAGASPVRLSTPLRAMHARHGAMPWTPPMSALQSP